MAKLSANIIIAIVLGSILFLIVTGLIIYYFIFVRSSKINKALGHYQKMSDHEKEIFRNYINTFSPTTTNQKTFSQNDQILNQIAGDNMTTPVR